MDSDLCCMLPIEASDNPSHLLNDGCDRRLVQGLGPASCSLLGFSTHDGHESDHKGSAYLCNGVCSQPEGC